MDRGLFITFFESGEAFEKELPPVGPLDHVVVRHRQLVADRLAVAQAPELGVDIARWLEAELELQRAVGEEPGGPKRGELRISAREGVLLRFVVFGDPRERDLIAELGPFAVVVVGRRGVEADGQVIATRGASELAPWDLTTSAGAEAAGLHKPDIAFRTPSTSYHAQVAAGPQRGRVDEIVEPPPPPSIVADLPPPPVMIGEGEVSVPPPPFEFRERERPPVDVYSPMTVHTAPPAEEPPALTADDLAMIERVEQQREEDTLRSRVLEEERRRLGVDEADDSATTWSMRYRPQEDDAAEMVVPASAGFELGPALWRLRFAIIGVLLLLTGAYGFTVIRSGGTSTVPGQAALQYVNIAQHFGNDRWDFVTNGVQRSQSAGKATPRGVYYVVRLGVTNKTTEGASLSPSQFVLIDANGVEHSAESTLSGTYQGPDNPQSQFIWPQALAVGKVVTVPVVFDVDPSLVRGNVLKVADLPNVRVRLD